LHVRLCRKLLPALFLLRRLHGHVALFYARQLRALVAFLCPRSHLFLCRHHVYSAAFSASHLPGPGRSATATALQSFLTAPGAPFVPARVAPASSLTHSAHVILIDGPLTRTKIAAAP